MSLARRAGSSRAEMAAEIVTRSRRYRARYGPAVPLNPMALAGNWAVLATDIPRRRRDHDMGIRGIRDSRGTGGGMRKLGDVTGAMMGDPQSARQRTTLAQPQPPQRRPHSRANTTTATTAVTTAAAVRAKV